jgi:hypothetical protein
VARIACLDAELNDRFIILDRDSLDLSTRYDIRDPSEIGAGLVFVLAKDVLHSFVDGARGQGPRLSAPTGSLDVREPGLFEDTYPARPYEEPSDDEDDAEEDRSPEDRHDAGDHEHHSDDPQDGVDAAALRSEQPESLEHGSSLLPSGNDRGSLFLLLSWFDRGPKVRKPYPSYPETNEAQAYTDRRRRLAAVLSESPAVVLSASETATRASAKADARTSGEEATMNRTSGMGLLVFGIVLGIAGAILRFAVTAHTTGFNIHEAGVILLVVGVAAAVVGLVLLLVGTRSRSTMTESVQQTPTGQVRTQERFDSDSDI